MKKGTGPFPRAGVAVAGLAVALSLGVGLRAAPLGQLFFRAAGLAAFPAAGLAGLWQEVTQPASLPAAPPKPTEAPSPTPAPAATPETSAPPTPAPTPTPAQDPPPGWGTLLAQTFPQASGAGAIPLEAGSIKNYTALSDDSVRQMAGAGLPFEIQLNSDQPQVLIMHTHATETYNLQSDSHFDPDWGARTTDTTQNVCAVGANIARELNRAGVNTLHDMTLHDYPSYNGSYAASNATVRDYLARYPSIKVVLDVHRDAIEREGSRVRPVTTLDGLPTAQVMIICGCDKNGNLPHFAQNLAFAAALETEMEGLYPTLTRPVLFDYRYYNQDLTTGSLLIEVGGHGNTLEEALNAGTLVGKALASLFTSG